MVRTGNEKWWMGETEKSNPEAAEDSVRSEIAEISKSRLHNPRLVTGRGNFLITICITARTYLDSSLQVYRLRFQLVLI